MMARQATEAEFAAAFGDAEHSQPPQTPDLGAANRQVMTVPATIYLTSGRIIDAPEAGNWAYIAIGVFVTGHWITPQGTDPEEVDIAIPYTNIDYIDFHFPEPPKEDGDEQESASPDA